MTGRFNVRVYGIWIHEGKLLINEELIHGSRITKFPGGGLNFGEGTVDCLIREWKEELGLDIKVLEHFYTTDFFQPSAFDDSQVISIYYRVCCDPFPSEITNHVAHEHTYWKSMQEVSAETFNLPIDKKIGNMLRTLYMNNEL